MKTYCPKCDTIKKITIRKKKELYRIQSKQITILATVAVCKTCKEIVYHPDIDSKNLDQLYSIYRQRYGEDPREKNE